MVRPSVFFVLLLRNRTFYFQMHSKDTSNLIKCLIMRIANAFMFQKWNEKIRLSFENRRYGYLTVKQKRYKILKFNVTIKHKVYKVPNNVY